MTDLDSAGLSAAEKALELLHHREPHPLRSSAVREVVRAYLAALSVPSDTEKPRPSPDDYREAVVALADSPEQRTAFLRLIDDVFAAGRAAATPDLPDEDAVTAVVRVLNRTMDLTARERAAAVLAVAAAASPDPADVARVGPNATGANAPAPAVSPDERLREADRAVILEWAKFTRDESAGYWGKREEDVYDRLLAAADREKPDEDQT